MISSPPFDAPGVTLGAYWREFMLFLGSKTGAFPVTP